MKREVLFRGKDDKSKWVYGYLVYSEHDEKFYIGVTELLTPIIKDSIGQYTGVKDKNEESIFEGDVLEDQGGNKGVVVWNQDDCSFSIDWNNGDIFQFLYKEDGQYLKVIGNIHD